MERFYILKVHLTTRRQGDLTVATPALNSLPVVERPGEAAVDAPAAVARTLKKIAEKEVLGGRDAGEAVTEITVRRMDACNGGGIYTFIGCTNTHGVF